MAETSGTTNAGYVNPPGDHPEAAAQDVHGTYGVDGLAYNTDAERGIGHSPSPADEPNGAD